MSVSGSYAVFIDGYNVIKRHPSWNSLALNEGRRRLLVLLGGIRWPMPVGRVTVVFDGPTTETMAASHPLQVQFAHPSADAYIQQVIRTDRHPAHLLVISDDGDILRTAKSHGVQRYATQWLLTRSRGRAADNTHTPEKRSLPASTARQITEELAKRWLQPPSPST